MEILYVLSLFLMMLECGIALPHVHYSVEEELLPARTKRDAENVNISFTVNHYDAIELAMEATVLDWVALTSH